MYMTAYLKCKMKELISDYCKKLRLGKSIVTNYLEIEAKSHEEFLVKLLQLEVENRNTARKNRYLKQAKFEIVKSFEDMISRMFRYRRA